MLIWSLPKRSCWHSSPGRCSQRQHEIHGSQQKLSRREGIVLDRHSTLTKQVSTGRKCHREITQRRKRDCARIQSSLTLPLEAIAACDSKFSMVPRTQGYLTTLLKNLSGYFEIKLQNLGNWISVWRSVHQYFCSSGPKIACWNSPSI
jgi:hypothetical protein